MLVGLEEIEAKPDPNDERLAAGRREALERLLTLIRQLKPLDRQIIFSYLEGLDAASIGEITGLSPGNVATKIHPLIAVAAGMANPGHLKRVWVFEGAYSAAVALACYFVARLNRRAAQRLQRRIDELDAMR